MLRWLHFIVFFALGFAVLAQSRQKITVEGYAIQGQNETEEEVVRRAFLDAQWKATRQAGEFVQAEEILVDYDIDEKVRSEYISSVNVVSPTVLRELTHSVQKTYDYEKEAQRFKVVVTYEFDRDEMEKKFRSFITAYKSQKLDVLNDLMLQYSRRLDLLDSLLEIGETETARYISLFTEASGIYDIISKDVEIRGNEISRIIEKQNEIYLALIDVYTGRLNDLFRNRYYLDMPVIKKRTFLEEFDVQKSKRYMVRYQIEWGWDNQYKSEISELKSRIEQQIPIKYQPYLQKKMERIDRRYRDLKITNSPANSNRFVIELKNPYYRVFLKLKSENGKLIRKDLLRNGISSTNIDQRNNAIYKDIIVLNRGQNSKLQYLNIDYKKNKLFSQWLGFKINTRYDYIALDTSSGLLINEGRDIYRYYGLSVHGFLNLKLSRPTPLLTASRLRLGLCGSILSYNETQGYNEKLFLTVAPVIAFETAKTKKRTCRGFGMSFSPKFNNSLGGEIFPDTDMTFQYTNEFQLYLMFGNVDVGVTYHYSGKNGLKGYGVRVGYGLY